MNSRNKITSKELICSLIKNKENVLITGPSGIGKTSVVLNNFPNTIYISVNNNTSITRLAVDNERELLPGFVVAAIMQYATKEECENVFDDLGNNQKVFNNDKFCALADAIFERTKDEKEPLVVMLDGLADVNPVVQSYAFDLISNKTVETNKGNRIINLPANTVVVATGIDAENLAPAMKARFSHIIVKPNVLEWLNEYAIPKKLHPAVIEYISHKYKQNDEKGMADDISYFYEDPKTTKGNKNEDGGFIKTNNPRNWETVSDVLYNFEENLQKGKYDGMHVETILQVSLYSRLEPEFANEFFDFYNSLSLNQHIE